VTEIIRRVILNISLKNKSSQSGIRNRMRLIIVVNTKKSNLKTLLDQGTMQNIKQLILRNLRRKVNTLSSFGWFIIINILIKRFLK
jgi:hypothetical protein